MNTTAERHLVKAKDYIGRGEEFYRKAADEIQAARDEGATMEECAERLGKSKAWVSTTLKWSLSSVQGTELPFSEPKGVVATRHARSVLREGTPEQVEDLVASLPREAVAKVAKAVSLDYERRGQDRKRGSAEAFRAELGDDFADGLDQEQRLRDAEAKVFEARRALRDMLALLNDSDLDAMRDSWREDFLKTLDDVSMRVDVARSLLTGALDEDLERFLSEV